MLGSPAALLCPARHLLSECGPTSPGGRCLEGSRAGFPGPQQYLARRCRPASALLPAELVHKATAKKKSHKAHAHPAKEPTDTNAQRTMARKPGPYADAGVTSSHDSVYGGVALVKGKKGQGAADLFSVSGQLGAQTEVQAGMGRVHLDLTKSGSVQGDMEVFTAHAAAGIHNEDGSTGVNESIGADIVKFGIAGHVEGAEVHVAGSIGVGLPSVHIGTRDPDHDGRKDLCAGAGIGPVEVSACLPNLIRW